jgi:hypothetical protein
MVTEGCQLGRCITKDSRQMHSNQKVFRFMEFYPDKFQRTVTKASKLLGLINNEQWKATFWLIDSLGCNIGEPRPTVYHASPGT